MHEYFGSCRVVTLVINSGFGNEVNVYVEPEDNKMTKVKFNKRGMVTEKHHFG